MIARRPSALRAATLVAALAGSSCHRAPPATVAPHDAAPAPVVSAVRADPCRIDGERKPWLARWAPAERDALEAAMRDGVAIVAADDCHGVRVLRSCHARGRYGYLGTSARTLHVLLSTDEEQRVNAPLAWRTPDTQADAGVPPLSFDVVRVGLRSTTRASVAPTELEGECDGATHFVRSVEMGASVVGAPVADAESRVPKACASQRSDDAEPPAGCRDVVAIRTSSIAPLGDLQSFDRLPDGEVAPIGMCPRGMVISEDHCRRAPVSAPYLCAFGDGAECRAQCDRGDVDSCDVLGSMLRAGKGVARDLSAAAAVYEKSCARGDAIACANLGDQIHDGDGVPKDAAKGAALLAHACELGEGNACASRAIAYLDDAAPASDPARGMALLERTCDAGIANACLGLAWRLADAAGRAGSPRATALLRDLCDGGNAGPCATLARDILVRTGDAGDHAPAIPLLDRACRAGFDPACVTLGLMYRQADGVARDDVHATRLLAYACERGDAEGCHDLAIAYELGKGVAKDEARAAKLYEQACDAKVATACRYLGDLAQRGTGVAKSDARARTLYARACALGEKESCAGPR